MHSSNLKVVSVELDPLPSKHYDTTLSVVVEVEGTDYNLSVSVAGYAPKASRREVERGWNPDWGMDHTESESHLAIAELICEALKKEGTK